MTGGLWRCIRCGRSFPTATAARQHHRDQHATTAAKATEKGKA